MYFERLEVSLGDNPQFDARVGDEVYSGATVTWDKLMRSDKIWFAEVCEKVGKRWADQPLAELVLAGPGDDEAPGYRLRGVTTDGGAFGETLLADLDDDAQAEILRDITALLEGIHALLIIE